MKSVEIILDNKRELILEQIPKSATNIRQGHNNTIHYKSPFSTHTEEYDLRIKLLGTYIPKTGVFNFNVDAQWVEMHTFNDSANRIYAYRIYGEKDTWDENLKVSFHSLLDFEIRKVFTEEEMPDKFIVLLKV